MIRLHTQDLLGIALRHQSDIRADVWTNQDRTPNGMRWPVGDRLTSQFGSQLPDAKPKGLIARILSFLF